MKTTKGRSPPTEPTHSGADTANRLCTDVHVGQIIQIIFNQNLKNNIMKTTAINNNTTDKKAENVNNTSEKINNMPVSKAFENAKTEVEVKKIESTAQPIEQPKNETVKVEVPQIEPKTEPLKMALNLEETLKLVVELNRKKIQRDKLLETIDNLDAFEIELREDADETEGNYYQGCVLTIEDDNHQKFSTKNPVIIWTVAQQVNSLCVNKLAEIEAGITIPA
jgi:hypothetical protein